MVKFSAAGRNAQRKSSDLLEALYVFVCPVSIDGETTAEVREDQGADQGWQKVARDLMMHVGQSDEKTVAFFLQGQTRVSPR